MYFTKVIELDEYVYHVEGEYTHVDTSFAHAFGIERGSYLEVTNLEIVEVFDECGETMLFDNSDKDMIDTLTEIVEDMLNES